MTKEELQELVIQVYATYAEDLYDVDRPKICRAWYALLQDLSYDDALAAFLEIATFSNYMPKPGTLRRATIDRIEGKTEHPEPAAAWSILQEMRKASDMGQVYQGDRPAALMETLKMIGESVHDLYTNGDRETFVRVYNKAVQKLDMEKYQLKYPNESSLPDGGG